ncbi:MAG TPA: hypothetical protein PLK90_01985 [Clostridiales bacterium]|nr:hypothetical protein [Clostridiales bacterium]HQP69146.1 hypothetical protein [Clostridiales bacterium]
MVKVNEKLLVKINEMINLATEVLKTKFMNGPYSNVSPELFYEFKTASLSFIRNLYSETHAYYLEFDKKVKSNYPHDTEIGRGILNAIKSEIENGWLNSVKGLVSAEIFSDFLEMAQYFLEKKYKDPAAVMIGGVLEEHLRNLCIKNKIDIFVTKPDGDTFPKKVSKMNVDLYKNNIYSRQDHENIISWLLLRNNAAHGKYDEYKKDHVSLMLQGVREFIEYYQL